MGLLRVRTGGDARFAPALAAEGQELPGFVGGHPRGELLWVTRTTRRQINAQAQSRAVPTYAHRAWTELEPARVVHVGDVLQLQPRTLGCFGGQAELDPG